MKTTTFLPKIILYFFVILAINSCAEKQDVVEQNTTYEVRPEIQVPEDKALVEIDQPFDIIADFVPYGDDSVVEIIQTKYINAEDGYELGLIQTENVLHHGTYSFSGTALPLNKGELLLGVCSYKDEIITQGNYSFFSYNGECAYRYLFAQDKVGEDLQVKTYLSSPSEYESVLQNEQLLIAYEYEIYKGDSGVLSIDILDENEMLVANLLETTITESGNDQLNYQFLEKGEYTIRIKAQEEDGSDENYWITKVVVN